MKKMTLVRANRVVVKTVENGYVGTFYRTHKLIAEVSSVETTWTPNTDTNTTANRELFRNWLTENAKEFGVEWKPEQQVQAWNRKYNIYMTDEQVSEDALELVSSAIYRLADKGKHQMEISNIEVSDIKAKESSLSYVEDGKYSKSQAWCIADIEITITAEVYGQEFQMLYNMEMRSGQICKPKTTIAEWNEIITRELELNEIEVPTKEEKTA